MDGIFAMYFTGATGSGHGLVLFKNGVVAGADALGGIIDGSYRDAGNGLIDVAVTFTGPAGGVLVTGAVVGQEPMVFPVTATLPADLGGGNALPLDTPTGPINIVFRRLRDVP